MRASYKNAVAWIAEQDNLGDNEPTKIISGYLTVALVADLFGKSAQKVAKDVSRYRARYVNF